jgi:hypothetical protein
MSPNDEQRVITGVWDFDGYAMSINPVHEGSFGWSIWELSSVPFSSMKNGCGSVPENGASLRTP